MATFKEYCNKKDTTKDNVLTNLSDNIFKELKKNIPGLSVKPVDSLEYVNISASPNARASVQLKFKPRLRKMDFYVDRQCGVSILPKPKHKGWNTKDYYFRIDESINVTDIAHSLRKNM